MTPGEEIRLSDVAIVYGPITGLPHLRLSFADGGAKAILMSRVAEEFPLIARAEIIKDGGYLRLSAGDDTDAPGVLLPAWWLYWV